MIVNEHAENLPLADWSAIEGIFNFTSDPQLENLAKHHFAITCRVAREYAGSRVAFEQAGLSPEAYLRTRLRDEGVVVGEPDGNDAAGPPGLAWMPALSGEPRPPQAGELGS